MSEGIDVNEAVRGLLDVAKIALGPGGPELSTEEAGELLFHLLAIVQRTMPPSLFIQDIRVVRARLALEAMKQ